MDNKGAKPARLRIQKAPKSSAEQLTSPSSRNPDPASTNAPFRAQNDLTLMQEAIDELLAEMGQVKKGKEKARSSKKKRKHVSEMSAMEKEKDRELFAQLKGVSTRDQYPTTPANQGNDNKKLAVVDEEHDELFSQLQEMIANDQCVTAPANQHNDNKGPGVLLPQIPRYFEVTAEVEYSNSKGKGKRNLSINIPKAKKKQPAGGIRSPQELYPWM
ncbi:hypothetical protein EV426DRAFT_702676 [Tirmania nivea]|nr:hypothetical protein EV426DRAFT_702676 [Tirmania nivea]